MSHRLALPAVCLLLGAATAQQMPTPAPQLQKLAPLIGSWHGTGTAMMGPGVTAKWEAQSSYQWALGNFFVQEDTTVRFDDMPAPLVMRAYLGWDAQREHFVAVSANNDGKVSVNRLEVPEHGSFVQLVETFHEGQSYFERHASKVAGDEMTFAIDMMGASGTPGQMVQGKMTKAEKPSPMTLDAGAFSSKPAAPIAQLAKSAGTYGVKATMIMAPGMPEMGIVGKDEVAALFGGTLVHVHTTGTADISPDEYVGEVFYGFDGAKGCIRAIYVSNMGEIGDMEGHFTPDNRSFILTMAGPMMGQPCAQRMVMSFDDKGAPTKAIGHCLFGTAEPFQSWSATYAKK